MRLHVLKVHSVLKVRLVVLMLREHKQGCLIKGMTFNSTVSVKTMVY